MWRPGLLSCSPTPGFRTASSVRARFPGCGGATCSTARSSPRQCPGLGRTSLMWVLVRGCRGSRTPRRRRENLIEAKPLVAIRLLETIGQRLVETEGVIEDLGLSNVTVARGRAEDFHGTITATYVTARAVARLEKLLRWCAPLVAPGGDLVAMKGASAEEELTAAGPISRRLGLREGHVRILGTTVLEEPTTVVVLRRPSAY